MATHKITYVDELDVKNTFVNMKVRIIKLWKQSFRLDIILIDEKGKKVQAVVKKDLIRQFEGMILEDTAVLIIRCGVASNEDVYPVIKHPLKLNFYKCTEVQASPSFAGDLYGFNFLPFHEITTEMANNKEVLNIDVIGSLTSCGNLDIFRSSRGKECKRFNLELKDLDGMVAKCTLWGDYAVEFSNFVKNNTSSEHVITIMQHAKLKEWGNGITVQTDMFGTRLFINPDIKEAQDFRRRLILKEGNPTASSSLISETVYPNRLDFLLNTEKMQLDEVLQADSAFECVVLAKIALLETEFDWFYVGCRKCNKKVLTKPEFLQTVDAQNLTDEMINAPHDSWWCPKENALATQLVPKFRVTFRVQDSTGNASFLMFDRDVTRILGLSANDIRERQIRTKQEKVYPHELNSLLDRKLAFKISISKYNLDKKYSVYTVLKYTDDPEVLKALESNVEGNEVNQDVELQDVSTGRFEDSSQGGISSKDAFSVTGDSLGMDLEKDTETSPLPKRANFTPGVESTSKPPKRMRKINISSE